jgi:hypothetical protein
MEEKKREKIKLFLTDEETIFGSKGCQLTSLTVATCPVKVDTISPVKAS